MVEHANSASDQRALLDQTVLTHGPIEFLGSTLLRLVQMLAAIDVSLEFATFERLYTLHRQNVSSWGPLNSMFDVSRVPTPPETTFCLVGHERSGRVVVAQGCRLFDLTTTNLAAAATSMQLFYPGIEPPPNAIERCSVTAPIALNIHGLVNYTGALWVHPDWRGSLLTTIVPRIGRVCAMGRWGFDYHVAFVEATLVAKGLTAKHGLKNTQLGFERFWAEHGKISGYVGWLSAAEVIDDLNHWMQIQLPQSGATSDNRRVESN
jgi:hypothetical protein